MGDVRRIARWALSLEATLLSIASLYLVVRNFGSDISDHGLFIFLTVVVILLAVLMWFAALGIPRGVRWPQAPTIMVQVSILLSCIGLYEAGRAAIATPLVIVALAAGAAVIMIRAEDARSDSA